MRGSSRSRCSACWSTTCWSRPNAISPAGAPPSDPKPPRAKQPAGPPTNVRNPDMTPSSSAAAGTGRQLHLNAFLMTTGHHEASWRLPESDSFAGTQVAHFQQLARTAERGTFDSIFFADSPVLHGDVRQRPYGTLEPTVLLSAIAAVTKRIGLIGTASTTYNDPYN